MPTHTGFRTHWSLIIFLLALTTPARGGGFLRGMLDMRTTSIGNAVTGLSLNGAASFYNPAAMTFLEYSQINAGLGWQVHQGSFLSPYTGNTEMDNRTTIPLHAYGAFKLNEKSAVGISINEPFRQSVKWPDDWTGRYIVKESRTRALYLQPSFAYMVSEKVSFGVGAVIASGYHLLTRDINLTSASGEVSMDLEGNAFGFGFDVSFFYKPNDAFSMGVNYRSPVKININDGDASFSNVPQSAANEYPTSTSFETAFTLPQTIRAGLAYKITRELTLAVEFGYTGWAAYDSVSYQFNDHSDLNFGLGKNYKNTFSTELGVRYELGKVVSVGAGAGYVSSPLDDEDISPTDTDSEAYRFSAGVTVKLTEHFSVDTAYQLTNIKEREAYNPQLQFGGNYKNLVNSYGLTLGYHF